MIENISFEPIVKYLFNILDINPKEFPTRPQEIWPSLLQTAIDEKIAHYFVEWSYENWKDFPEKTQQELKEYILKNQARNIFLQSEIVHLATLFRNAEIPIMFLKGCAGLVRGLYPLGLRFISDIDALVHAKHIDATRKLLAANGFTNTYEQTSIEKHHHIEPYRNPQYPGEIEIHVNPYDLSRANRTEMPEIWNDAERIPYRGEKILVPSITDHAWILMRTDILNRPFLPRINNVIEMFQILQKGYSVDFHLIKKRAEKDNISHAVEGMSHACSKYMGLKPFSPSVESELLRWEKWTLEYKRKFKEGDLFALYFAGIRFLPSGYASRIRFLLIHHREFFKIVVREFLLVTGLLEPLKKIIKKYK